MKLCRIDIVESTDTALVVAVRGALTSSLLDELTGIVAPARAAGRQVTLDLRELLFTDHQVRHTLAAWRQADPGLSVVNVPISLRRWCPVARHRSKETS